MFFYFYYIILSVYFSNYGSNIFLLLVIICFLLHVHVLYLCQSSYLYFHLFSSRFWLSILLTLYKKYLKYLSFWVYHRALDIFKALVLGWSGNLVDTHTHISNQILISNFIFHLLPYEVNLTPNKKCNFNKKVWHRMMGGRTTGDALCQKPSY